MAIEPHNRSKSLQSYYDNRDNLLPKMRVNAKRNYLKNKETKLKKGKMWRDLNKDKFLQLKEEHKVRSFFKYRATTLRKHGVTLNTNDCATKLFWIWIKQKGICAYTGRKLHYDKTTHIDHIIPRSKGGSNYPDNFQFICSEANQAKSNLTHDEFIMLIKQIMNYSIKQ
jgi:CRISPR/Cas system Type II protein with McrA/HNH and RuvC-like nuclease domain